MRPTVLSIAGFDPSSGAGLSADIKTFEQHRVYGLSVCTAVTVQNDVALEAVDWMSTARIIDQIGILGQRFSIQWVKIGLIEKLKTLEHILDALKMAWPEVQVIWDPILVASAGYVFHETMEQDYLQGICNRLFLATPNRQEYERLFASWDADVPCALLIKGGHWAARQGTDILQRQGHPPLVLEGHPINAEKHGSGCVLSSAITANLAKGQSLPESCRQAKAYVRRFLESNGSLLGYHYP